MYLCESIIGGIHTVHNEPWNFLGGTAPPILNICSVWGWPIGLAPLPFYLLWDRLRYQLDEAVWVTRAGRNVLEEGTSCFHAGNRTTTFRSSARNPVGIPHDLYCLIRGTWTVCGLCSYSIAKKCKLCITVGALLHFPQHLSNFCPRFCRLNCSLNQLNPVQNPHSLFLWGIF
jgi:hypothetical protein